MAEVTVFVDDAVLGRLPRVCAKRGTPTGSSLRAVQEVGRSNRLGILWLLALAGPLGWLVLLVLSSRDGGEHLAVELPLSDGAYDDLRAARRLRTGALLLGTATTVGLLVLTAWAQLGPLGALLVGAAALVTFAAAMVGEWRVGRASVGIALDASRRWVTLNGVHPGFVDACRVHAASHSSSV